MSTSSVKELQFAMHGAAYSCNDVMLVTVLTWKGSKTQQYNNAARLIYTVSSLGILI